MDYSWSLITALNVQAVSLAWFNFYTLVIPSMGSTVASHL